MAKKKDREGLFDPKHYWARRVKAKYTRRGGKSQYPAKVGDWTMDESWYDAIAHGNRAYETESASFDHRSGHGSTAIYHHSSPKGETWQLMGGESYDSLKDALAALKRTEGRKRKAAPKKRRATPAPSKSRRSAANYFNMSKGQLVAAGDAGARGELTRRGRDPKTGKKRR